MPPAVFPARKTNRSRSGCPVCIRCLYQYQPSSSHSPAIRTAFKGAVALAAWSGGSDGLRHVLPEAAMWPCRGPGQARACLAAGGRGYGGGIVNPAAGRVAAWPRGRQLVRKQ